MYRTSVDNEIRICFRFLKYLAVAAGAPVRPNTSGDIFAPINLGFNRPGAHFYEKLIAKREMSNVEDNRRTAACEADHEEQAQLGDSLAPMTRAPKLGRLTTIEGKIN